MDNKQFLMYNLLMIAISLGISISISLLLPFYLSLPVIIAVFILINFYMRNRMMKKMGGGGGMFGSMSSPFSGNSVNYYCMSCGTKHREASCPRCGSKMKELDNTSYFVTTFSIIFSSQKWNFFGTMFS